MRVRGSYRWGIFKITVSGFFRDLMQTAPRIKHAQPTAMFTTLLLWSWDAVMKHITATIIKATPTFSFCVFDIQWNPPNLFQQINTAALIPLMPPLHYNLLRFCAEDIQMPDSQGTKSYDSRDRGSNPSRRGRPGGRVYYVPDALSWELNPCHKLYLPPIDFTPEPERAWRACLTFPIKQCGQEGAEAE
ncbi:MAG: hypothetical protein H6Q04_1547 [Acidobacteria bacterium]|nr:hypothetical protein [Acidobacteriota bacterium]